METTPHDDLDKLLEFLVMFAQRMLRENGQFYPFATGMTAEGNMTSVEADTENPNPRSQELIGLLFSGLSEQARAGEIIAGGICMDVSVVPPDQETMTDAICVELEHESGDAIHVFVPYVIDAAGVATYGESFATAGEQRLFLPIAG